MARETIRKYRGLIPAAYTPFHADGSLNTDAMALLYDNFRSHGSTAVFVCGTTGEFASLTVEERKQTAGRWVELARCQGEMDVIVHVGHDCLSDACALAEHAAHIRAQGVAAVSPSYYKSTSVEQLIACLKPIAQAAHSLPFYYYHIPGMTGVTVCPAAFIEAAARDIPNFAGLKYTSTDLMHVQNCIQFNEQQYNVFFGSDENLLAGLSYGVTSAVGSTYNFAMPLYQQVMQSFERGDHEEAARLQFTASRMVHVLYEHGIIRAGKAIMEMIGLACGPVRLPLEAVTAEQRQTLRDKLAALGFFDWCNSHQA